MDVKSAIAYEGIKLFMGVPISLYFQMKCEGEDNVPKEGPALIVSNHRSMIDPIALGNCIERPLNFAAAAFAFKMPVIRDLFALTGAFPLDTTGGHGSIEGLRNAIDLLEAGELVGIFPEGEDAIVDANRSQRILSFKTGFVRIAIEAKAPIVPVALAAGEERRLPTIPPALVKIFAPHLKAPEGVSYIVYRRLKVRIGQPVDLSPYYGRPITKEMIDKISGKIRRIIVALYDNENREKLLTGTKPFDFEKDKL